MASVAKSLYILPTHEQERKRLGIQNDILRTAFGGIVFAPIELHAGDKVLDSGTGSAYWLLDCYDAHKDVTFHGFDLKTDIFPTLDDEQKQQIHLEAGNVLQLPSDWTDKFQLVNQRFLIAGLSKDNWDTALEELHRVLAPGAWVQLVEGSHCVSGEATRKHLAMLHDLFVKRGLLLNCVEHIPKVLKDLGFDQVKAQRHEICLGGPGDEDEMNVRTRKNFLEMYKSMQPLVVAMGVRTEEEFKEIIEDLEREWESNVESKVVLCIFVAQRSSI